MSETEAQPTIQELEKSVQLEFAAKIHEAEKRVPITWFVCIVIALSPSCVAFTYLDELASGHTPLQLLLYSYETYLADSTAFESIFYLYLTAFICSVVQALRASDAPTLLADQLEAELRGIRSRGK